MWLLINLLTSLMFVKIIFTDLERLSVMLFAWANVSMLINSTSRVLQLLAGGIMRYRQRINKAGYQGWWPAGLQQWRHKPQAPLLTPEWCWPISWAALTTALFDVKKRESLGYYDTTRHDTIQNAIFTCAQKLAKRLAWSSARHQKTKK